VNPLIGLKPPEADRKVVRALSEDELKRLINICRCKHCGTVVTRPSFVSRRDWHARQRGRRATAGREPETAAALDSTYALSVHTGWQVPETCGSVLVKVARLLRPEQGNQRRCRTCRCRRIPFAPDAATPRPMVASGRFQRWTHSSSQRSTYWANRHVSPDDSP
jgi:hypothetical protein